MSSEKPINRKTGWTGRSKARGFHFSIFLWVMRNGGMRGAYLFLYLVVSWFFLFDRKSNRYTRLYYRKIWGFSRWKTFRYVFKTYYRFGQVFLDKVAILSGMHNKFDIDFNGHELLVDMGKRGTGGVLISAHIGSWEIAGHFLKNANRPVNVVMYDAERAAVKHVLSDSLKNRSFNIISVEEDYSHLMEIKRAIDDKEFICMHGDRVRDTNPKRVHATKFLGHEVLIPRGPFDLAARFDVPWLYVFAVKTSNYGYKFKAFQPDLKNRGDVPAMIDEYVSFMEEILADYPEQWFNFYDYWGMDSSVKENTLSPQFTS